MIQELPLVLALVLGLFSTLHCLGMCGNIMGALSMGLSAKVRGTRVRHGGYVLTYNLGRLLTYALLGAMVGATGQAIGSRIDPDLWHSVSAVVAGLVVMLVGLYLTGWLPAVRRMDNLGQGLWQRIEPVARRLLPVRSPAAALMTGMLWGLLPCGLVYYALLLGLPLADPVQSALFMLFFGLGTLPSLLLTGLVAGWLANVARRPRTRQAAGMALIVLGASVLAWDQLGHHHDPAHVLHSKMAETENPLDR